jgi:hypothetical protein
LRENFVNPVFAGQEEPLAAPEFDAALVNRLKFEAFDLAFHYI